MKISDKLSKVEETVTVQMYDNGFLFEISGRNHEDDWSNVKILCTDLNEISALITEANSMERS
jgi:hypothetical protein